MEFVLKGVASAALSYTVHYTAARTYAAVCVQEGLWGFLQSALSVGSPMCKATQTIVAATETHYSGLLTSVVSRILIDLAITGIAGKTPHTTSAVLEQVNLSPPLVSHTG